jgi:hypothetical protein
VAKKTYIKATGTVLHHDSKKLLRTPNTDGAIINGLVTVFAFVPELKTD